MRGALCLTALGLLGAVVLAAGAAALGDDDEGKSYFYRVTETDATVSIKEMNRADASDLSKELEDKYGEEMKKLGKEREAWCKLAGHKKYPVPQPKRPEVRCQGSVPSNPDRAQGKREALQQKLEVWKVCFIKDLHGEPFAHALRDDQIFAMRTALRKDYAEAVMAVLRARAEGGEAEADEAMPVVPVLMVKQTKNSMITAERSAARYAEKFGWRRPAKYNPANRRIDFENVNYTLLDAQIFFETNRERVLHKKGSLRDSRALHRAAAGHCRDMIAGDFFSHENPHDASKRTARDRIRRAGAGSGRYSENLAVAAPGEQVTYLSLAKDVVAGWMKSPGHRANLLDDQSHSVGCAARAYVSNAEDVKKRGAKNRYCVKVCQNFSLGGR